MVVYNLTSLTVVSQTPVGTLSILLHPWERDTPGDVVCNECMASSSGTPLSLIQSHKSYPTQCSMQARSTALYVHVWVGVSGDLVLGFFGCVSCFAFISPQSLLHTVLRLAYIMQTHTPTPLMSRVLSWVKIRGRCACACMRACVVWLICLISVLWILLIPLLSTLPFISPRSIPPHPLTSIICSLALLLYLPHPAPRFLSSSPLLQRVFLPFFIHFILPQFPPLLLFNPSPPLLSRAVYQPVIVHTYS